MGPPMLRIPRCITRESVACATHDVNHTFLALVGEVQRGKQGATMHSLLRRESAQPPKTKIVDNLEISLLRPKEIVSSKKEKV